MAKSQWDKDMGINVEGEGDGQRGGHGFKGRKRGKKKVFAIFLFPTLNSMNWHILVS
jgi:hypothetical protein